MCVCVCVYVCIYIYIYISLSVTILKQFTAQLNGFKYYYLISIILSNINHIYPTPPHGQDMSRGQFLSGV